MRITFLCAVVILTVAQLDAAPAPTPGLKTKERWYATETVEVRIVRMLGPSQAKVVLMSRASDRKGEPDPHNDKVFAIFLDFYDGT